MAKDTTKKHQIIKPNDFVTSSPYFHSYADAFSEKAKEVSGAGSRAYTKDFGPIEAKTTPQVVPVSQPVVEAAPVKKSKRELAREAADCEAARRKEEKRRRIEEAKLRKRQERIKKIRRKRIRREKDYFFVMRKGVCFLMMILMVLIVAVVGAGFLGIEVIEPYTAAYKNPDLTPLSEQVDEIDPETEEVIPYEDQSTYISILDPVFGFLKQVADVEVGESPFYDAQMAKVEAGMEDAIAPLVLQWFPIAIILLVLLALINLIKAFFGMLGQRIFKRFGLSALVMMIMAAVVLFAGYCSTLGADASLNFGDILPFVMQLFVAPVDGVGALAMVVGYGTLGLFALSLIALLFSMGMRKKIPYSVFD